MTALIRLPTTHEMLRLTGEDCFKLSPLDLETVVDPLRGTARPRHRSCCAANRQSRWSRPVATDRIRQSATR
ncbi:hypothetical protein RGR602_CH00132 [Rhizobium gallicum bv. gallicum R602sp]|uniref:Uncharacterized protein n=1 Tax=Rhizobium gallicum bv. gallicum R602sp TaxID=1041138 RepID=A0A0B4WX05_9HYPH|nr:hypothetical protein RGR602_CH00132 [Rhizobium gallicum bv. gallicum R602sp]